MPRAGWVKPESDQRLSDHIALGVLMRTFPSALVDEVVEATGKAEQRSRLLPARLVVYYALAMALFSDASYEEVIRNLVEGLAWESGWKQRWIVPTKGAISLARDRLGSEPLEALFERACVPLASTGSSGAFYKKWRVMSMDGTTIDLADTDDNVAAYGRPNSAGGATFPQLHLVGLAECGTHALCGVAMGPSSTGEPTLAKDLVGSLSAGMLVLADRSFTAHPLFSAFAASGTDLLWRAKSNTVLPILERFSDGSFRSEIASKTDRSARGKVTGVRVIECTIDDPGGSSVQERYRLVSTIMDSDAAPSAELAGLYAGRWEFEKLFDEVKTHERGTRVVLRSKSAEGVRQEAYAFLCVHYAIRALMSSTADHDDIGPDRVTRPPRGAACGPA
jgi:hypothetical protein